MEVFILLGIVAAIIVVTSSMRSSQVSREKDTNHV